MSNCLYEFDFVLGFFCIKVSLFPTGPPVQQQEEQMDFGAATPDVSEDAALSQVNKRCQTDRALPGAQGWMY